VKPPSKIVIVAVTRKGVEQARLLRARLRAGEVHRPDRYGPAEHAWEHPFEGGLAARVPELFRACEQMVFFLATGAVVRLIAGCLVSKESDPGVLAVDEAGRFVIPVLSGHKGGANAFARTVAGCLGATPVITTASDVMGGQSLDLLEDAFGWVAEPRGRLKATALALVNGEPLAVIQEVGCPGCWLDEGELPRNVVTARDPAQLAEASWKLAATERPIGRVVWITDRLVEDTGPIAEDGILWFRPKSLVLGVGCERGLAVEALEAGLEQFLRQHRFSRASIATLASVDLKADEPALLEFSGRHGWQTIFYPAEELARIPAPNPSPVVARCVGTPGVAEPAALLAAGAGALLVEKEVVTSPLACQRMTFALARLAHYSWRQVSSLPSSQGDAAPRGKVVFVGAGPGSPDLLTLKAQRLLSRADVVVYAGSLVPEEVLRHAPGARLHDSAPLTLEEVMERLITAARSGKRVVRLHSGDTSLYSAVQEQMALLDEAGIDYEVVPGVSSFQAAAAALKAELTLPEVVQTVILTRAEGQTKMPPGESLEALARHGSTLCLFLSARLVEQAQEQLLTGYAPDTPVAILYRVSWPDEKIILTELKDLAAQVRQHKLARTTLILVGAAVARRQNRSRLYHKDHGHLFRARSRDETSPSA
jgi:precorrin-4 C11-methyltransferase